MVCFAICPFFRCLNLKSYETMRKKKNSEMQALSRLKPENIGLKQWCLLFVLNVGHKNTYLVLQDFHMLKMRLQYLQNLHHWSHSMTRVSVNFLEYWDKLEIFTLYPNKVYDASSYAIVSISNTKQSFTKYLQAIRELCDSQRHFEWNPNWKTPNRERLNIKVFGRWTFSHFQDSEHVTPRPPQNFEYDMVVKL